MLNEYDLMVMHSDVRDIIWGWRCKIDIMKPLPIDKQPDWNNSMHEYKSGGAIAYDLYHNVVVERRDQQDKHDDQLNIQLGVGAGDHKDGIMMFSLSDLYKFIDLTCIFIYDNDYWRVKMIKPRIGENLCIIHKEVSNEVGINYADVPTNIYDMSESSLGNEYWGTFNRS